MVKERQVGVGVTTEGRSCKQLVRLFAEWISAGVITQSVAMSDARYEQNEMRLGKADIICCD